MASEFNEREHFALFHTFFIFSKCLQSLVCVRAKMCVCARNKRFVCHLWMCKCASVCAYWCYSRYVTKCKLAEREKNEQSGQNCCKEMNKISFVHRQCRLPHQNRMIIGQLTHYFLTCGCIKRKSKFWLILRGIKRCHFDSSAPFIYPFAFIIRKRKNSPPIDNFYLSILSIRIDGGSNRQQKQWGGETERERGEKTIQYLCISIV